MLEVDVVARVKYRIKLPINSFEEIMENHMQIEQSDKMAFDYLGKQYGVKVEKILSVNQVEQ